jgi:hypothetical protein
MLSSPRWKHLENLFEERERREMGAFWHRFDGTSGEFYLGPLKPDMNWFILGWGDSSPGLHSLKRHYIIATLSNGNVRLLADIVRILLDYIRNLTDTGYSQVKTSGSALGRYFLGRVAGVVQAVS